MLDWMPLAVEIENLVCPFPGDINVPTSSARNTERSIEAHANQDLHFINGKDVFFK